MVVGWPGRYFISHAYKDEFQVEALKKRLPFWMIPVIFPPRKVSPDQMVSNPLMSTIRRCQGLVYLQGGASEKSFWVAMERDYALRMRKRVYAYNPSLDKLSQDRSPPLEKRVFNVYSRHDNPSIMEIDELMRERAFNLGNEIFDSIPLASSFEQMIVDTMESIQTAGGYVILYWSRQAVQCDWMRAELDMATREYPNRLLVAQLDDTPLPAWITERVNPDRLVQLFADRELSLHKIDDLYVRLEWLIYQNTRGKEGGPRRN